MGKNATVKNIIYTILVVVVLIYTLFPLYWLFLASLKTRVDLFTIPPKFVFEPTFDHFKKIFIYTSLETGEQQPTRYLFWLLNSVLTAGIGTLLAVTLGTMAGYIIPQEVEEAAFVNGYTRFQVFIKVLVPMVKGGIAATAGFCFIFAWNEFTFASIIATRHAMTLPPRIVAFMGSSGFEWGIVAASGFILITPIFILFILIRKYLLMGMTFGVLGRK
jgi:ABC-type glycerol-3-phosphate transport system permease component